MKRTSFVLLFFVFISMPAFSQEKMKIAILDLEAEGVEQPLANQVSDLIRDEFINSNKFIVIEKSQVGRILEEQEYQNTGCVDSACAVEIGKLISARKMMIGKVAYSLGQYNINVRIVDVEKGTAEFSAREEATEERLLRQAVDRITDKLIARIEGRVVKEEDYVEVKTVEMSMKERNANGLKAMGISIIPGLGQVIYGDRFALLEGIFFFAGTATLGYFTYSFYTEMNELKNDYKKMPANLNQAEYDKAWDKVDNAKKKYSILLIATAGFYALNFVDAYFAGRRPHTKEVITENYHQKEGFYVYLNNFSGSDDDQIRIGYRLNFK